MAVEEWGSEEVAPVPPRLGSACHFRPPRDQEFIEILEDIEKLGS